MELIVDNFAGGGGASTGIEMAIGRSVDIAINHDPDAIAMHKANHPNTRHYCEDVRQVDPVEACGGKPVALAWFSPDCKHFSRAKGGKPVDKNIRGLAWVAIKWALLVRPRVIMLENVPEIQTWGPLGEDGKPIKEQSGETFDGFLMALSTGLPKDHPAFAECCEALVISPDSAEADRIAEGLGYNIQFRELKSCDYGAPTTRTRFYMIARCDGKPIVWPQPTHAKKDSADVAEGRKKPYRTAAECIDWSIPAKSIFERDKPLAENTLKRIARGIQKFVIENPEPFIVTVNHSGEGFRGQSINEPLHNANLLVDCYNDIDMHNYDILNQSDARLKKNIKSTQANALDFISRIEMKEFDWIETDEHCELGMIAQQLREVAPHFVNESKDTGRLSIKINKFIPYLIKAVQELSAMLNKGGRNGKVREWTDSYGETEKAEFILANKPKGRPKQVEDKPILLPANR